MRCPECRSENTKVVDSRTAERGAACRRRRECLDCGHRFTTYERLEPRPVTVLKRDGSKEPFSKAKLERGLARATAKGPVAVSDLAALATSIERFVENQGRPVKSAAIAKLAMDGLADLDDLSYLRFASVCKAMESPAELVVEADGLTRRRAMALA